MKDPLQTLLSSYIGRTVSIYLINGIEHFGLLYYHEHTGVCSIKGVEPESGSLYEVSFLSKNIISIILWQNPININEPIQEKVYAEEY